MYVCAETDMWCRLLLVGSMYVLNTRRVESTEEEGRGLYIRRNTPWYILPRTKHGCVNGIVGYPGIGIPAAQIL